MYISYCIFYFNTSDLSDLLAYKLSHLIKNNFHLCVKKEMLKRINYKVYKIEHINIAINTILRIDVTKWIPCASIRTAV